jgi:hypothetical protein
MTLKKVALIAEVVGGAAVVLTLIALLFEVRANTEISRNQAAQEVLDRSFRGYTLTMDPASYTLWSALVVNGLDSIDPDEQGRATFMARAVFIGNDNAHYQYRQGYLDDEVWQAVKARMQSLMSNAGIRDWWQRDKHLFTASFQEYVNEIIEEE